MPFSTWILFVVAATVIAISPGSGAVLSMSHGLAYGFRKASATVLGLQCGLLLLLVVAGAGVGSLLLASEVAFNIVKVVGALYLVYLGVSQWRAKVHITDVAAAAQPVHPNFGRRVLTGFLTNATNPKGIIFMVAILPQFISHQAALLPQLLILGATMVTIDTVVMHGYALLAASMQGLFRNVRAVKVQNRFFGGVLMLVGSALLFVKRGGTPG
jgi:homoserine/homoserine lactone efflux protein